MKGKKKILFIVCDGMGDLPEKELAGKTPLEAAFKPNMNALARGGKTGLMYVVEKGLKPESDSAHLSLFGYDLKKWYIGRGPFEAAGLGIKLKKGDVAFRTNFATVNEEGDVVDRRAGRIEDVTALTKKLDGIKINGITFLLKAGISHRAVLVMRGNRLSANVSSNDPHKENERMLAVKPLENETKAIFTAKVLDEFLEKAHKILDNHSLNLKRKKEGKLPADYLLVRGAGMFRKIPSFKEMYKLNACCIAGGSLYNGIALSAGMKVLKVKGATGTLKTNLKAKFSAATKALKKFDFVFLHIKGTDLSGHDGKCLEKKAFIEKIDKEMKTIVGLKDAIIVITSDHCTPCSVKDHSADAVPLLIFGKGKDIVTEFSEKACEKGSLGLILGKQLMKEILK